MSRFCLMMSTLDTCALVENITVKMDFLTWLLKTHFAMDRAAKPKKGGSPAVREIANTSEAHY